MFRAVLPDAPAQYQGLPFEAMLETSLNKIRLGATREIQDVLQAYLDTQTTTDTSKTDAPET